MNKSSQTYNKIRFYDTFCRLFDFYALSFVPLTFNRETFSFFVICKALAFLRQNNIHPNTVDKAHPYSVCSKVRSFQSLTKKLLQYR